MRHLIPWWCWMIGCRWMRMEKQAEIKQHLAYDYDDVDLVRFAAQNVYAPMRLIKPLPGVMRVPVPERDVSALPGG